MARLSKMIKDRAQDAKIQVSYMDREATKWMSRNRGLYDPPDFCGFYWYISNNQYVNSEPVGPFRTWSAALADGYKVMGLARPKFSVVKEKA